MPKALCLLTRPATSCVKVYPLHPAPNLQFSAVTRCLGSSTRCGTPVHTISLQDFFLKKIWRSCVGKFPKTMHGVQCSGLVLLPQSWSVIDTGCPRPSNSSQRSKCHQAIKLLCYNPVAKIQLDMSIIGPVIQLMGTSVYLTNSRRKNMHITGCSHNPSTAVSPGIPPARIRKKRRKKKRELSAPYSTRRASNLRSPGRSPCAAVPSPPRGSNHPM